MTGLTLEQQFKLKAIEEQTKSLSHEETRDYLLQLVEQNMIQSNLVKQWMKTK